MIIDINSEECLICLEKCKIKMIFECCGEYLIHEKCYKKWKETNKICIIKKLKEKKKLLPIVVAKENKKYRIIDGHHRYDAYKKLGKETIKCIVIPEKDVKFKNLTKKMEKKLTGK